MRHQVLDHPGDGGGEAQDEAIAGVAGGDEGRDVVVREKHLEAAEDKGGVDSNTKHILCVLQPLDFGQGQTWPSDWIT